MKTKKVSKQKNGGWRQHKTNKTNFKLWKTVYKILHSVTESQNVTDKNIYENTYYMRRAFIHPK